MKMRFVLSLIAVMGLFMPGGLQAAVVTFSVTHDAPANGLWIMRPWVGPSDGGFTTYTIGQPASAAVQHEPEEGMTGDPSNTFPPSNASMVEPGTTPFGPTLSMAATYSQQRTTNIFPNINGAFTNPQDPIATIEITWRAAPSTGETWIAFTISEETIR
jgi:hypothetical protein